MSTQAAVETLSFDMKLVTGGCRLAPITCSTWGR